MAKGIGRVHVGHAVRHQDHVVVRLRVRPARIVGEPYRQVEPGLDVRAGPGTQLRYGPRDVAPVGGLVRHGVLSKHLGGEVHHRYAVASAQAVQDGVGRLPRHVHPVAVGHGAGRVQHKRHVHGTVVLELRRLEPYAGQVETAVQRMREDVGGDGEAVGRHRLRIVVEEGVYPLLGAHRLA